MRRRELILGLAGAAASISATGAQQPGRIYRIGSLFSAPRDAPHHIAIRERLRDAGFVEGENLSIDWEGFGLSAEQFDGHAAEIVKAGVDVIMAGGDAAVRAAQRATAEIPILALTDDMLGQGFVRSLAKPGGNTTGVTIVAFELDGKRQEILLETIPGIRRIGALADANIVTEPHLRALRASALEHGVELSVHSVARPEEIVAAIDAAGASGATALNVLASALFYNNRPIIFDRLAARRMPAIFQWPEMAAQGGLIAYGPSIVQLYGDVQCRQLLRLLRGAKPADLPVEQPTKFELVLNLKTAKALGLTVPQSILARADEVIE
jgi:ABC-type uncharacterized transport system substrate-binding protein